MLILSRAQVEELLDPQKLLSALADGFKALSAGEISAPPRNQVSAPKGFLLGMPAYMPGKHISTKIVTVFQDNAALQLPSHQALIALFDSQTGALLALMDGEHITAMRTAAAAILSVTTLARKASTKFAIIGAGVEGRAHLRMIGNLPTVEKIWIASREAAHAHALAAGDPRASASESIRVAVANADVVCLCTSSAEPVIEFDWLKVGTHVTSIGYRPPGGELSREIIGQGRVFVETMSAFDAPPVGSVELQGLDRAAGSELGEVLLQKKIGRASDSELTIYKSMGHAMEDLVAANLVYDAALVKNVGAKFEL